MAAFVLLFLFYAASLGIYSFSLYWTIAFIPIHRPIVGFGRVATKMCYLTTWDVVFQILLYSVSVLEIVGKRLSGQRSSLTTPSNLRRFLTRAFAGPLGFFVTITFWGLFAIDREFVMPRAWQDIPEWWNQLVHTLPFFTVVVDRYLCDFRQPAYKSRSTAYGALIAFGFAYVTWLFYLGFSIDFWLYPIFKVLDSVGRAVFVGVLLFVLSFCFYSCDWIARRFWDIRN